MATLIQNLPEKIDYSMWKGDTWAPGTLTASLSGTPINLTGYTAKMEIRNFNSGEVALTLTSPSSGIVLTSLGVITLTMTAAQTDTLLGEYAYDLQMTLTATGAISTYTYGVMTVTDDSTAN